MNLQERNEADGLGVFRGLRTALPIALVLWLVIGLVGALVAKWAGWL